MAKTAAKSAKNDPFLEAYQKLRAILVSYSTRLNVMADKPKQYMLETKAASFHGKPMFFAGVSIKKSYVSFYFMPIYVDAKAFKVSPELKKRQQGMSCFNFKAPDEALFADLAQLTEQGFEYYKKKNLL